MSSIKGSEWNRWDLHIHTASSYDSKYQAKDADDVLCEALRNNEIKAVAITDHFTIDSNRIESLRAKAPDIVFFPGVELRTDKGASNLHMILIFSEKSDLKILSDDFNAIMLRDKAKASDSLQTIYWSFDDIIEFANKHDALITIHAGKKSNGIDKEITNALPVQQAIKEEIANSIHFFEIGQKKDIADYEKYVFKDIARKPLIMCSDCHNPREYTPTESLWIKSDLTFSGLKQCIYQPLERVYIGTIPPMLDRFYKNKQVNIEQITVKKKHEPINNSIQWFDFCLQLNPGMVAIIGNKGSGKSALSDILGHLCKCKTMKHASFLNNTRFGKPPKNYSKDYIATIAWADGEGSFISLDNADYKTVIEDAQYLPQKYIEDVCNDMGNSFQQEIDNVIFSYIDPSERGNALNLNDLVQQKSEQLYIKIQVEKNKLRELNSKIIRLETKKTNTYKKQIEDSLNKLNDTLNRHDKSRPVKVEQPNNKDSNTEYQTKLNEINKKIQDKQTEIDETNKKLIAINGFNNEANLLIAKIEVLETQFEETQQNIITFFSKHNIINKQCTMTLSSPKEYIKGLMKKYETNKNNLYDKLNRPNDGLIAELEKLEKEKQHLISSADATEKIYQKYLADIEEWNKKRLEIIGNKDIENTLEYYKYELNYINNTLEDEYNLTIQNREKLTRQLYNYKSELVKIYQAIYLPVQDEITSLLGELEDSISFKAELSNKNDNLAKDILQYINQKFKGKFGHSKESFNVFDKILRNTDFNSIESVLKFINEFSSEVTENLEIADMKVRKHQEFYDFIFGLDYIGVNFKLKMGNRSLEELSPGERGIVLLIFYLALSKESKPIIIDQPEDNLDNQSIYSKLVPCICKAKQNRQVIIVTHNPNIAVACDAEQIIYCKMDKNTCQIHYTSGAIENPEIKKHVIDVLEGTMPAFDLRKRKYN